MAAWLAPESNFINFKHRAQDALADYLPSRWDGVLCSSLSPSLSLCLALIAEDDRNDSLLRTLQISPISEDSEVS